MGEKIKKKNSTLSVVIRFVINAIVLMIVSYFIPGFVIKSFWVAIIAAVVISMLDYLSVAIFKIDASPFGRGISGFIIAVVIIYLTSLIIPGFAVTIWGAIIGALLIGIIDAIIPSSVF